MVILYGRNRSEELDDRVLGAGNQWLDQKDHFAKSTPRPRIQLPETGARGTELGGIDWNAHKDGELPWHSGFEARIGTVQGAVSRRPLSEGYHLEDWSNPHEAHVALMHNKGAFGTVAVGNVQWHPKTGEVNWLGVDEDQRHLTAHLMTAAVQHADEKGIARPTWANDLTDYSNKLVDKYAPENKPGEARIEGRSESDWYFAHQGLLKAKEHVNSAVAAAQQEFGHRPEHADALRGLGFRANDVHNALDSAVRNISASNHRDAKYNIVDAVDAADTLHEHIRGMGGYASERHADKALETIQDHNLWH